MPCDPTTNPRLLRARDAMDRDFTGPFETLRDRGLDITDEPAERPYGIDFGIRDPFGNAIRIGQMFDPNSANEPEMNP